MHLNAISVLLPLGFVLGLGYLAGRRSRFDADQIMGLNTLVLTYALPALLFVATASTPRARLLGEASFALALLLAFAGTFVATVVFSLRALKHSLGEAALQGNMVSYPSAAFFGPPIFRGLFGDDSLVTLATGTLLGLVTVVPMTIVLLEIDQDRRTTGHAQATSILVRRALRSTVSKPLVWAPLIGVLLALFGLPLPAIVDQMFQLIGSTTGGVSIFLAGLIIAANPVAINAETIGNTLAKMVAQPLLMAGLVAAFGIPNPLAREGILLCAIPSAMLATMLAPHYGVYEAQSATTLLLTTLAMIITVPVTIVLTGAG